MYRFYYLLFAAALLPSCSRSYFYNPLAVDTAPDTRIVYNQGVPSAQISAQEFDMSTALLARSGSNIADLNLRITSFSKDPLDIDPTQIRAIAYNSKGEAKELTVYSPEQFIKRSRRQKALITTALVGATVATAVAVANADDKNTENNQANDNDDFYWYWAGLATPSVVYPADYPPTPYSTLVRRQTLFTGEELSGIVKIKLDPNYKNGIDIISQVSGEELRFSFGNREQRF